jgi:hypothetical protein
MIGLGSVAPGAKTAKPVIDPEAAKEMFARLYVTHICPKCTHEANTLQTWKRGSGPPRYV